MGQGRYFIANMTIIHYNNRPEARFDRNVLLSLAATSQVQAAWAQVLPPASSLISTFGTTNACDAMNGSTKAEGNK